MCLKPSCNYEMVAAAVTSLRGVNFDTRMNIPARLNWIFFPCVCLKKIDIYIFFKIIKS